MLGEVAEVLLELPQLNIRSIDIIELRWAGGQDYQLSGYVVHRTQLAFLEFVDVAIDLIVAHINSILLQLLDNIQIRHIVLDGDELTNLGLVDAL